jgi:hypothetical protein
MTNIKSKKVLIPTIAAISLLAVVMGALSPISALADPALNNRALPQITGSVNVADTMKDYVKTHATTSFSEAASAAENQIANGSIIGGHVGIVQGYLVYNFKVIDTESDTVYMIMIDAGNGKILHKSEGIQMKEMGGFGPSFGGQGFDKHGFGHGFDKKMMPQGEPNDTDSQSPESQ